MTAIRQPPKWLGEFDRKTALISVIKMAFNPAVDDKTVRQALMDVAEEMGEVFMPSETPPSGPVPPYGGRGRW